MPVFESVARIWFDWIAPASWQLAILTGIVALIALAAQRASCRFRYALWLIVLVKVFLPPSLTAPWSLGRWAIPPMPSCEAVVERDFATLQQTSIEPDGVPPGKDRDAEPGVVPAQTLPSVLLAVWFAGVVLFGGVVTWRYFRVLRAARSADLLDEGPARILLERLAIRLGAGTPPEMLSMPSATSPFLFGVLRPRIVLPERLARDSESAELRSVLAHELVHHRRRDTLVGWIQVLVQGLFWFHPCVWWANARLRHERECVCDDAVLRTAEIAPAQYGEAMIRVLMSASGRSTAAGSLVGILERGTRLQNRLEEIMSYEPMSRHFVWTRRGAVLACALLLLPMAPAAEQPSEQPSAEPAARGVDAGQVSDRKSEFPTIVATSPKVGAVEVDPSLSEITVTFDRDMERGMSWTGGPPLFPPIDESRKARWKDARTCVLPVILEKGTFYRVGINSKSHQNFCGKDGKPTRPATIYFVTAGATDDVKQRVEVPKIVSIDPENGANDVDPATKRLRVTFDRPMGGGMSWTGSGPKFPELKAQQRPTWSKDRRTCTLPVVLEPDHDYVLGLNSPSHNNFQSEWGVPLEPVVYKFHTK